MDCHACPQPCTTTVRKHHATQLELFLYATEPSEYRDTCSAMACGRLASSTASRSKSCELPHRISRTPFAWGYVATHPPQPLRLAIFMMRHRSDVRSLCGACFVPSWCLSSRHTDTETHTHTDIGTHTHTRTHTVPCRGFIMGCHHDVNSIGVGIKQTQHNSRLLCCAHRARGHLKTSCTRAQRPLPRHQSRPDARLLAAAFKMAWQILASAVLVARLAQGTEGAGALPSRAWSHVWVSGWGASRCACVWVGGCTAPYHT